MESGQPGDPLGTKLDNLGSGIMEEFSGIASRCGSNEFEHVLIAGSFRQGNLFDQGVTGARLLQAAEQG